MARLSKWGLDGMFFECRKFMFKVIVVKKKLFEGMHGSTTKISMKISGNKKLSARLLVGRLSCSIYRCYCLLLCLPLRICLSILLNACEKYAVKIKIKNMKIKWNL